MKPHSASIRFDRLRFNVYWPHFFIGNNQIAVEFMKNSQYQNFGCSQCRFFQPDGHYHGNCNRLNVTVEGKWQACYLALHAFVDLLGQPI
jgi:hypothetical protein